MSKNPAVAAAKRDLPYLLSVLGISSSKTQESHAPCPLCGDATCLQYGPDKKYTGEWFWHCNKGCGGGNVIEALKLTRGFTGDDGWKLAYDQIEKDFNGKVPKGSEHDRYHKQQAAQRNGSQNGVNPHGYLNGVVPALQRIGANQPVQVEQKKQDPVLDMTRAEEFVEKHHAYLMDNFHLVTKWGRGLSADVCAKYRIGFVEFGQVQFSPWGKPMDIPAAWVLPITDENNTLKGVKVHFEERPNWGKAKCPKLLWLPLGTVPAYKRTKDSNGMIVETKPIHNYITMWPHPATLQPQIKNDFSLDATFWIERIPPSLRAEWDIVKQAQGYKLAYEIGKMPEDFDPPTDWEVSLRTFEEMKQKIFKAVLPQENALAKASMKSNMAEDDWSSYIFICPGELKALACESAGMMATAGTGGEGVIPGHSMLTKFAGQKVCILGDEDSAKRTLDKKDPSVTKKINNAGRDWVDKWVSALHMHGAASVMVKFGGQKDQEPEETIVTEGDDF